MKVQDVYTAPKQTPRMLGFGKWIQAAGKCGLEDEETGLECDGTMEVMLGNGSKDLAWATFRCSKGHEEEDDVGWTFCEEPIWFQGRRYWGLSSRANHGPCANCGRIIWDIPLILWGPQPNVKYELDFCFECVEKIPITVKPDKPKEGS